MFQLVQTVSYSLYTLVALKQYVSNKNVNYTTFGIKSRKTHQPASASFKSVKHTIGVNLYYFKISSRLRPALMFKIQW